MRTLTVRTPTGWKRSLAACLISMMVMAGAAQAGKVSDQQVAILEAQTRMLLVADAQQAFTGMYKDKRGNNFDEKKTRMLLGAELKQWLLDHRGSLDCVPEPVRTSVQKNEGMGLLIQDAIPDKKGTTQDVVYLRPPRFGVNRVFVNEVDPCGDGNPATCEYCSGCSGDAGLGGIIKTCVCTMGCGSCRPCPTC